MDSEAALCGRIQRMSRRLGKRTIHLMSDVQSREGAEGVERVKQYRLADHN
jgi:hypothetical protein